MLLLQEVRAEILLFPKLTYSIPCRTYNVLLILNYSVTVATVRCSNISPLLAAKYPIPKCSKLCAYHTLVPSCRALAKFLVRSTLQLLICKWRWAVFCSLVPATCNSIICVLTFQNIEWSMYVIGYEAQFTWACTHHIIFFGRSSDAEV
jgi:hypothetical protein